jgi:hypothetical protein
MVHIPVTKGRMNQKSRQPSIDLLLRARAQGLPSQKGPLGLNKRPNGTYQRTKAPEGVNYSFGASGATPDWCAHAHLSENKHVLSLKKQHACGQATEPLNKHQKYFLGRLRGYYWGQ